LPVLGVPIIDRTLATLSRAGIRDVVITVGFEGEQVRRHVGDGARFGLRVRYACNDDWDAGNARSVAAARPLLAGDFLLLMGDHLVDERIVAAVARQEVTRDVLAYAVTALYASGLLLTASLLSFVVGVAEGLGGKLARVKQQVSRVGSLEHAFDMLYDYSWILALAWAVHRDQCGVAPLVLAGVTVAVVAFYRSVYDQYGKQAGHSLDDAGGFDRRFRRVAGRRNLYNLWILAFVLAGAPAAALWAIAARAAVTGVVYGLRATTLLRRFDRTVRPMSRAAPVTLA
jgi:phosphatidylglycerophosphate synthase